MNPFFWKKTMSEMPSLIGNTDWHCHILPGVDDGVRDISETLEILCRYAAEGIKEVWLTPHIMEDFPNATDFLRKKFEEVVNAYSGDIKLNLGSENMLDSLFEERLANNDLLPVGESGEYLLVETSYFNPPLGLKETLKKIMKKGYIPLLAHPERYIYMDRKDYRELKDEGVSFQLNLLSFGGYYGKEVRDKARWIYKNHLHDVLGTDLHSIGMLDLLRDKKAGDNHK